MALFLRRKFIRSFIRAVQAKTVELDNVGRKEETALKENIKYKIHDHSIRYEAEDISKRLGVPAEKILSITVDDINEQSTETESKSVSPWISHHRNNSGTISFKLSRNRIHQNALKMVREQKDRYGTVTLSEDTEKQRILIEYSSPNIAKPFHAGHFRSTILGNIIANLYEASGHTVFRINYLGDWGIQYGLLGYWLRKYGREDILESKSVKYMLELYIKANEEKDAEQFLTEDNKIITMESQKVFRRLEEGDPEELRLWKKCRDLSVLYYEESYQKLGIKFTDIEGESMYLTQTKQLINDLKQRGLLQYRSDTGVGYMKLKPEGLVKEAVLVRSNGTSLYLTRDVAAAFDRHKRYQFDRCYYVVEQGQYLHFKQLGRILKELDVEWAKRYGDSLHVAFGRIGHMSTRRGNHILLLLFLDDLKQVVLSAMDRSETTRVEGEEKDRAAEVIALTTLVFWDLRKVKKRDYTFDWTKLIQQGTHDGSMMHYCHSRLCSLLSIYYQPEMDEGDIDLSLLPEDTATKLISKMIEYEAIVESAVENQEPHEIAFFLKTFRNLINSAMVTLQVKDEDPEVAKARLQLFKCCKTVMANGMQLLGITPLEKM
ncbi:probable arginine--tRNA ligase, mitochondrial [Mizuhopecten yessoensis]|uniref:Probable arginine--tRNA ligase, mitochondrial n=1 Tax=Mizuhopecten yessoensis TaxID=6573 RepID=A0A210PT25_MIZYE|nr:probable arginine--tRNA ligase, mitochondrial [Mizuhopecten yessoensis]OWF39639.1 arginine--tRNA ligase, mitochondrial [Mizuhopecten yessoensis]